MHNDGKRASREGPRDQSGGDGAPTVRLVRSEGRGTTRADRRNATWWRQNGSSPSSSSSTPSATATIARLEVRLTTPGALAASPPRRRTARSGRSSRAESDFRLDASHGQRTESALEEMRGQARLEHGLVFGEFGRRGGRRRVLFRARIALPGLEALRFRGPQLPCVSRSPSRWLVERLPVWAPMPGRGSDRRRPRR